MAPVSAATPIAAAADVVLSGMALPPLPRPAQCDPGRHGQGTPPSRSATPGLRVCWTPPSAPRRRERRAPRRVPIRPSRTSDDGEKGCEHPDGQRGKSRLKPGCGSAVPASPTGTAVKPRKLSRARPTPRRSRSARPWSFRSPRSDRRSCRAHAVRGSPPDSRVLCRANNWATTRRPARASSPARTHSAIACRWIECCVWSPWEANEKASAGFPPPKRVSSSCMALTSAGPWTSRKTVMGSVARAARCIRANAGVAQTAPVPLPSSGGNSDAAASTPTM